MTRERTRECLCLHHEAVRVFRDRVTCHGNEVCCIEVECHCFVDICIVEISQTHVVTLDESGSMVV